MILFVSGLRFKRNPAGMDILMRFAWGANSPGSRQILIFAIIVAEISSK
jgi:hypothetical protein